MKVYKFGGASIKDYKSIKRLAKIIRNDNYHEIILIVSAMGKTTNSMEDLVLSYTKSYKNLKTKFKVKTVNFLNLEPVGFQLNQGHRFDNANKRYNIKHSYNQNFVPLLKKVKPKNFKIEKDIYNVLDNKSNSLKSGLSLITFKF